MADKSAPVVPQATKDRLEGRNITEIVTKAVEKHGQGGDALIPILSEINSALGYIPAQAISEGPPPDTRPGQQHVHHR